jgi:hypothetical protein
MSKKSNNSRIDAWTLDQLAKSVFFHRKLHEWKLLEVSSLIDQIHGENLSWENLNISEQAWNRIIHRGIKPVTVFAHPTVLKTIPSSTGYYRMLAMVSQKSMKQIGLNVDGYELGKPILDEQMAIKVTQHLNRIISALIEADETIDAREFDLWRAMAAGSQAQGSWQNKKGSSAEIAIREVILRRLQELGIITDDSTYSAKIALGGHRMLVFGDEPDIAIYQDNKPLIAVEIKGGIDPAAVLERIGAALKSLQRTRQENPLSITILIVQDVSMTERAKRDLNLSAETVTYLFSIEQVLEQKERQAEFFQIMGL